jgi:hypothetical protein
MMNYKLGMMNNYRLASADGNAETGGQWQFNS